MMHNEEFEYKDGYCEYSRSTSRSNPEKQEKSKGDKINVLKNVQPASNTFRFNGNPW